MKKIALVLGALVCFYTHAAFAVDLSRRPDIQAYIQTISQKYQFDQAELTNLFNQVDFLKFTMQKARKPSKPKPFYAYRDSLITPARVKAGVAYWEQHREALLAAEKQYGVPVEIMLGILGIETSYGANTGHYSAFQGLMTLAFNHASRRPYFTSELTHFLLLCREHNWNPLKVPSSFDGGLGLPQFMPSSYREYAVSTTNQQPNLFNDNDAIVSMANYLRAKGWQPEQPVVVRTQVAKSQAVKSGEAPKTTVAELKKRYGVAPPQTISPSLKAGVLALQNRRATEHWLAFENFAVIKKYNNSTNYAMTVYQLGDVVFKAATRNKT